jgi:choline dehydrogenase-like flavoprotein
VQILELSGIGDPEVLRNADVKVVVDLPGVGNNVQEHYNTVLSYRRFISSCLRLVTMKLRVSTEVKEEFESEYLTLDCLQDPDELKKQMEL